MIGYCDGCDYWGSTLYRKGRRWLCLRCLGCEL